MGWGGVGWGAVHTRLDTLFDTVQKPHRNRYTSLAAHFHLAVHTPSVAVSPSLLSTRAFLSPLSKERMLFNLFFVVSSENNTNIYVLSRYRKEEEEKKQVIVLLPNPTGVPKIMVTKIMVTKIMVTKIMVPKIMVPKIMVRSW